MADTRLSALTELAATPADADEVYIRDVSEATSAESKRITIANLLAGAGGASVAAGSYSGNSTTDRQITVGFKCSLVIIVENNSDDVDIMFSGFTSAITDTGVGERTAQEYLHASDGFIVSGGGNHVFNTTGDTIYYWAISE